MGTKRPYDEDYFEDLSFKQAKQFEYDHVLNPYADDFPSRIASQKAELPEEADSELCKSQENVRLESDSTDAATEIADKELERSIPSSWVTSSSCEEDSRSQDMFSLSHFPEYFDGGVPRRVLVHLDDPYSTLLNRSPRKEVPLGPNYQADVPVWDPDATRKDSLDSNSFVDKDFEQKLMGTCIIPMPDLNSLISDDVGDRQGFADCFCEDAGSVRCVRQHVNEAREKLKETLGIETFLDLGFYNMGEVVASRWTEEEEDLFHEVVYSNPVSLGRNFWKHLSVAFPTRTKRELVGYYFNVFMLRRRAVQNRSNFLDIDSDDDEWQGADRSFYQVGEDDDSIIDSSPVQGVHMAHEDYSSENEKEYRDDDEDEGNDEDDNDGNSDGDGGAGQQDTNEVSGGRGLMSECEDCGFSSKTDYPGKAPGNNDGDVDAQEESVISSDNQHHSVGPRGEVQGGEQTSDPGRCLVGKNDGSFDGLGFGFLLEPCEAKVWDDSYSGGLMKSVDLLPTCSMMDEIFGPYAWNKSSNDETIS